MLNRGNSGLVNVGNTCYLNALVQCLSATNIFLVHILNKGLNRELVEHIAGNIAENDDEETLEISSEYLGYLKRKTISYHFIKLIKTMWSGNFSVKPKMFCNYVLSKIKFYNFQQDSHELLNKLLENIHDEISSKATIKFTVVPEKFRDFKHTYEHMINEKANLKEINTLCMSNIDLFITYKYYEYWTNFIKQHNHSSILDIFGGTYLHIITCLECNVMSPSFEYFVSLDLNVNTQSNTLEQILQEYIKPEVLDDNNLYNCEFCNKKTRAKKQISLWNVPERLIIYLKKYEFNREAQKITKKYSYPEILNIDPFVSTYRSLTNVSSNKYSLYGVITHFGSTEGGHYIAHTKNFVGNGWTNFDDNVVSMSSLEDTLASNGYIFFYKKLH